MKILSKLLVLCMAFSIIISLAACNKTTSDDDNKNGNSGKIAPLKAVTLKFTLPGDVTPKGQDPVITAVEQKLKADGLNFKIQFTYIPWGEYWNRISMIAAAGEDQDMFLTHSSTIGGLVASEATAPLNAAIDAYGPILKANIPDYYWKGVTIEKNIYGIPRTAPSANGQQFLFVRKDLLKKYGMETPKSFEDVAKYYENIKKNETGMFATNLDHNEWMMREFGAMYFPVGSFSRWPVYVDVSKDKMEVKNWYESTYFKTICNRNLDFYKKGYRPKDLGTVTDDESWFANNKLASVWSSELKPTERVDKLKKTNPSLEFTNVLINTEKPKTIYSAVDNIISVYASSTKVNESVAFMNWLRTNQENFDLFNYGIKGTNYNLKNEQLNYDGISADNTYIPTNFAWSDIRFTRYSDKLDPAYIEELKSWDKDAKISPLNGFIANLKPIQVELAQVQSVEGEYVNDLAYGVTDYNKVYAEFSKKLKDAGIETIRVEIQKQVDAYIAANK